MKLVHCLYLAAFSSSTSLRHDLHLGTWGTLGTEAEKTKIEPGFLI
jgi:hypothetical protein